MTGERAFPPEVEAQIAESVRDMLRYLNDLATVEQKCEAISRLLGWVAMEERLALPEIETRN
jgi:hypothetical protein